MKNAPFCSKSQFILIFMEGTLPDKLRHLTVAVQLLWFQPSKLLKNVAGADDVRDVTEAELVTMIEWAHSLPFFGEINAYDQQTLLRRYVMGLWSIRQRVDHAVAD